MVDRSFEVSAKHDGDEFLYVTAGTLRVLAGGADATLEPGDGFYVPAGVPHSYEARDGRLGEAILGVAPQYAPRSEP